jgi:hypothetical protein
MTKADGGKIRQHGKIFSSSEPLALDAETVSAVLGPKPPAPALAQLEAEVRAALAQYRVEVSTGVLGLGALLVRGRPLADYLPLDQVARLLRGRE